MSKPYPSAPSWSEQIESGSGWAQPSAAQPPQAFGWPAATGAGPAPAPYGHPVDPGLLGAPPPGGYSGHWYPAGPSRPAVPGPPRRGSRLATVLLVTLVFAVGLLAVGAVAVVGTDLVAPPTASNPGAVETAKKLGNVPGTSHAVDIRTLLAPVPSGGRQYTNDYCLAGEAVTPERPGPLVGDPGFARVLQLYRFKQGAVRCWATHDQIMAVLLMQFAGEQEAASFITAFQKDSAKSDDGTWKSVGVVPGVPGSVAIQETAPDADGTRAVASMSYRGDIAFLVFGFSERAPEVGRVNLLTREQFDLL